jgi:hypothetical protein
MYYEESLTLTELDNKLPNVKRGTISDIIYGRTWSEVSDEYFEVREIGQTGDVS